MRSNLAKPKIIKILLFLVVSLFSNSYSQGLTHAINPNPEFKKNILSNSSSDTIKILAVMVEFAEDKDASTYGNGKFGSHYTKDYKNSIIDPLPHNQSYFENQLKGLKNYYYDCSNGKVVIAYTVLNTIIQMPEVMSKYSPPPRSNSFDSLGKLFVSVWKKVDSIYATMDFSGYSSFIIFHAGVGRDINLTENFNLDKDIPSVYLSLKSLKKYFGNDFNGVEIGSTKKLVNNSMLIPETESREVSTIVDKVLIQIGIRGLLISSFASFLGLPDLYNTSTGLSEIGRFGLMDGQAIFNYGGVLPPEPSAWEKIYLGWVTPIEINIDKNDISVLTRFAAQTKIGDIIKIPINSSEYFLIENRQRDALKNGAIIQYILDGQQYEKKFNNDTTGFYYYNIDSLNGVIVGADESDWALPGSGILIWHIDEKIIANKFSENQINADHKNRGIFLEEADGIQDIGVKFYTIFGDEVVGDGEPNDMWFKENSAKLFKNEFTDNTLPSTKANSGSPSFVSLTNFSKNQNLMSFNLSFGNTSIKPIFRQRLTNSIKNGFVLPNSILAKKILFVNNMSLFYFDKNENKLVQLSDTLMAMPVYYTISSVNYFAYIEKHSVKIYSNMNDVLSPVYEFRDNSVDFTSLMLKDDENEIAKIKTLYCGDTKGNLHKFSLKEPISKTIINIDNNPIVALANKNNIEAVLTNKNIFLNNQKYSLSFENPIKIGLAFDSISSKVFCIVLYELNKFETFDLNGKSQKFNIDITPAIKSFSIGNINGDGNNYIVIDLGYKLLAYNMFGYLASVFPIESPNKILFKQNNYLVDINNDNIPEIFSETEDGQLLCYSGLSGKLLDEKRVSMGNASGNSSLFMNEAGKLFYHSLSDSGHYQIIQISSNENTIHWNGIFSDSYLSNSSYQIISRNQKSEFFPKAQVYNWPNPVYDKVTYIRYFVKEDSKINIKIYDLSGASVAELNNNAPGGLESETSWDVTNIQNGVYLARVEASTPNKTEFAIIKIAIIK